MNDFEARFTFFWYNDQEIFHDTQADIDAKLARVAAQGITHVMTFSCTHFRWAFRPWWGKLNECLAKIVIAAHKHGVKVIEHHSSELCWYPNTPERLEKLRRKLADRASSLQSWPGIVDYLLGEDSPALKWALIDEKTGLPHVTHYAATSRCFNQPEYVEEYLKYLEGVYATGVDGIMTDDVQYHCHCVCPCCRNLFKERYGHELPSLETWDDWFGDMRDPSFVDWLRFRFESTHAFHVKVKEHYDGLGLLLLRPNYLSLALTRDWTAFSVDDVPQLDWYFQECARSCVIRYAWLKSLAEQKHRAMIAEKRKIPHGILNYAYDDDQLIFTWGAAMLAGGFYVNTPEGAANEVDETRIRRFEKNHSEQLFDADLLAAVGFIDSRENRLFSPGYEMSRMEFWLESCIVHNVPCRLLDAADPASWSQCRLLCVNEVRLLTDGQIADLRDFAERGGSIIISGIPGCQKEDGRERLRVECERLWGIPLITADDEAVEIHTIGSGKICVVGPHFGYPGTAEEKNALFKTNHMDFKFGKMPFELLRSIGFVSANTIRSENKRMANDVGEKYQGLRREGEDVAELIRETLGDDVRFRAEVPELVLAAPFLSNDKQSLTIRLLNAAGTLTPPNGENMISHDDPIPYPPWEGEDGKFTLTLPLGVSRVTTAEFLEVAGAKRSLDFNQNGTALTVTLPPGMLRDFGMILISLIGAYA